jgi:hypothetical protein
MTHTESTPTASSTAHYVVTFGSYDDAYVLDGEFATENDALVAAARHCLDYVERHHRMPDPFTVERREDVFKADRDLLGELAASIPTPFDERALADTDAIIDMTGMAVTSTAAILAIRALMDGKRELAVNAWAAVQHGKRGERWAAARERAAVLAEVVAQIDTVIAERMS